MQKPPPATSTTSPRRASRAILVLAALLPALAGCGDSSMATIAGAFRTAAVGGADLSLTRDDVARVPYASIAVRQARGAQAFVVLAHLDPTSQQWVSADHHLIETRNGRITRTVGFASDLTHSSDITPDPLQAHLDPAKTYAGDRLIDITDHAGITGDTITDTILIHTTLTCSGPETITILKTPIQTYHWTETVTAPDLKWSTTNQYWQDQTTRTIWQTSQTTTPQNPKIQIQLLRRYE